MNKTQPDNDTRKPKPRRDGKLFPGKPSNRKEKINPDEPLPTKRRPIPPAINL